MISAPLSYRRVTAAALAGFYLVASSLPTALAFWVLQAGLSSDRALSQSMPFSPAESSPGESPTPESSPAESPGAPRPTSHQLVDEARQRLIQRGELPNPNQPAVEEQAVPTADDSQFSAYYLGPGDSIYVNVLRFPDLSFQGTLDLNGNLIVPLAGGLHLQGLTVDQARAHIRTALDRFVINPQVDITLIAQRPVEVTILGEVLKPGLYPLQTPQLAAALISAGGTTRLADLRSVRVRRYLKDGSTTEENIDLYTPLRSADSVPEIRLADGDTIVVPTLTTEAQTEYDRNLIARTNLAQQQITVRVLNYTSGTAGGIGNIQLANGSNFVDALTAIAPDLNSADLRHVALVRFDVQQGKAVSRTLDGKKALLGDMSQNPILEQNDVVIVGRNLVARVTYFLNTFTQPFRDVLGFLLFFNSLVDSASNIFAPAGGSSNKK